MVSAAPYCFLVTSARGHDTRTLQLRHEISGEPRTSDTSPLLASVASPCRSCGAGGQCLDTRWTGDIESADQQTVPPAASLAHHYKGMGTWRGTERQWIMKIGMKVLIIHCNI